jgi:AbrB family looped-hinge helix DNA binding protein
MRADIPNIDDFFYGSATIGERGQIVIPADARKECDMHAGEKLLVFRHPMHPNMLVLARVNDMQQLHEQISRSMELLNRKLEEEENANHVEDL